MLMLSKHRDGHTYDEQWIVESNDVRGLTKDIARKVAQTESDGELSTVYWKGVEDAVHTLFSSEGVDSRIEFMQIIEKKREKRGY